MPCLWWMSDVMDVILKFCKKEKKKKDQRWPFFSFTLFTTTGALYTAGFIVNIARSRRHGPEVVSKSLRSPSRKAEAMRWAECSAPAAVVMVMSDFSRQCCRLPTGLITGHYVICTDDVFNWLALVAMAAPTSGLCVLWAGSPLFIYWWPPWTLEQLQKEEEKRGKLWGGVGFFVCFWVFWAAVIIKHSLMCCIKEASVLKRGGKEDTENRESKTIVIIKL